MDTFHPAISHDDEVGAKFTRLFDDHVRRRTLHSVQNRLDPPAFGDERELLEKSVNLTLGIDVRELFGS
jgi:hypothetical protein